MSILGESGGWYHVRYGGQEGYLSAQYVRGALEAMDGETFELYMRYHLTVCERGDLVGASHHVLDILQKQEEHAS